MICKVQSNTELEKLSDLLWELSFTIYEKNIDCKVYSLEQFMMYVNTMTGDSTYEKMNVFEAYPFLIFMDFDSKRLLYEDIFN